MCVCVCVCALGLCGGYKYAGWGKAVKSENWEGLVRDVCIEEQQLRKGKDWINRRASDRVVGFQCYALQH